MGSAGAIQFIVDDWGMSPAINEAAVALAKQGHLFGVSALAESRYFNHGLAELLRWNVKIGCHINLTFTEDIKHKPLWKTILSEVWQSYRSQQRVAAQIQKQVAWIQAAAGRVDYLDGHHHIHLYPGILDQVMALFPQIPVRLILDKEFFSNYLLGCYGKARLGGRPVIECDYLKTRAETTRNEVERKIADAKGRPLVIHPAVRDDFAELGVADSLRGERVHQFRLLQEVLG